MTNILIGILIMSVFTTVWSFVYESTYNELFLVIAAGPPMWIIALFAKIVIAIKRLIRGTRALVVCPDGEIRRCNSVKVDYLLMTEKYELADFKTLGYPVELWARGDKFDTIGSTRYCPRKVWKHYKPVPKKVFRELR